uniref:N-myc downstream regulated 1a n=1 Tax=Anabas testudineus TaxID=64144 RepID=A0A7N6A666_ANATE
WLCPEIQVRRRTYLPQEEGGSTIHTGQLFCICCSFPLFLFSSEEHVETQYGNMHCIMTGTRKANRPVILTFHDIGLNHKSCFETLFNHMDMQEITRQLPVLCVYCYMYTDVNIILLIGLCFNHPPFTDQLFDYVLFRIHSVIGLGVGAGAYILARFALNHPDLVDGLVLININPNSEGLMHTVANKVNKVDTQVSLTIDLKALTSSSSPIILNYIVVLVGL